MRKILSLYVIGTFVLASMTVPPCSAEEEAPVSPVSPVSSVSTMADTPRPANQDPPGELILADVLFLRPAGLAACVVGMVGSLVVLPFAATSNSVDRVNRQLLIRPFQYTFERPLGQMDP